jgi:hypothetical protein
VFRFTDFQFTNFGIKAFKSKYPFFGMRNAFSLPVAASQALLASWLRLTLAASVWLARAG